MMRLLALSLSMALLLPLFASASDSIVNSADQIVVDKSTRNRALNDYVLVTRDAIQRAWTTPVEQDSASAVKGSITIYYTVSRSGAVDRVDLVHGSGNGEMDRSLVQAIRQAAPFPPLPQEIAARQVLIKARFIVADMPTVPVTTVDAAVKNFSTPQETAQDDNAKKFKWGVPAATSSRDKLVTTEPDNPPAPRQIKKFRWGLEP
jgi:TonB family protein